MRKGFTRKPQPDESAAPVKNYITPSGLQRLKDEHRFLLTWERPAVTEVVAWAAGNGDRSENADYQYGKRRLRQIDGRIRFLTKRIEAAEVVDPKPQKQKPPGRAASAHESSNLQGRFDLKTPGLKQGLRDVLGILIAPRPLAQPGGTEILVRSQLVLLYHLLKFSDRGDDRSNRFGLAPVRITASFRH
jgi:hypothetical protein